MELPVSLRSDPSAYPNKATELSRHSSLFCNFGWATTMAALLQSPPSVSSRWTAIFSPCRVRRCEKLCTVNARREDDYHATLKALQSRGRTPRKSLGQHYMLNHSINEQLVKAAEVKEGDVVLEIGPGTGSLTNALVNSGAMVVAIEKDPHMAMHIGDRFGDTGKVKVLQEDFTRCHIRLHLSSLLGCDGSTGNRPNSTKVVANIPFNITTDVVKQLLPMGDILSQVVLLVQDETALRLVDASLGTSEYRPINIFVNFYSDAEYKFKVPRTNFFPQPNVDGAVVSFKLKQPADYPEISSPKTFFSMVNSAFNGKRKMLRRSLQHFYASDAIEEALSNMGLPTTTDLDLLQMLRDKD
ncbi:hypothetical protein AMTR_s00069p00137360 [Amborella trichopoda]|uniref:rRNA adenine N(6)-methyltransferase n=1 Tax=Amborella trichopoda TaxID=13333 RepID=U5DG25_AMBTC|nr:hypothetical protein AMTR_s00069p00137360 [Amborella trichopoda]